MEAIYIMWIATAGLFMGWSLGANDAANVFGPAVGSGALRFWAAANIAAVCVIGGAIVLGSRGFLTYEALGAQTLSTGFFTMIAAAITVTLMSFLGLPVSTTQAVVGAIVGASSVSGGMSLAPLAKIFLCWVVTPIGSMATAYVFMKALKFVPPRYEGLISHDRVIRAGLIFATCYSAFALGANNVANVTGVYVVSGLMVPRTAVIIGSIAIAAGMLTFSRRVVRTIGGRLVPLDSTTALVVLLAEAVTLNIYALLGVPVSASQAVVGAVLGVGFAKGVRTINGRMLVGVLLGWVGTPIAAAALSAGLVLLANLVMSID